LVEYQDYGKRVAEIMSNTTDYSYLPIDTFGKLNFEFIVRANLSKEDIVARTKEWVAIRSKTGNRSLVYEDIPRGRIIFRHALDITFRADEYNYFGRLKEDSFDYTEVTYTLSLYIVDGVMKLRFLNIMYDYFRPDLTGISTRGKRYLNSDFPIVYGSFKQLDRRFQRGQAIGRNLILLAEDLEKYLAEMQSDYALD
jgi:hypothetical protein